VLALLFCTTHLHYTQNMMEKTPSAADAHRILISIRMAAHRQPPRLFIGSSALGLNLLTRLTTGLTLSRRNLRLAGALVWRSGGTPALHRQTRSLKRHAVACCGGVCSPTAKSPRRSTFFFLAVDRIYQFYRFVLSPTPTFDIRSRRAADRSHAARELSWSTPFHEGVFGALFKPEKSIFLFDPLLVLTLFLLIWLWKRMTPELRAYGVTSLILLAPIFVSTRDTPSGAATSLGDRYVSTRWNWRH